MKNTTNIFYTFQLNGSNIKRLRKPVHCDADEHCLMVKQKRSGNVPVSGPVLMLKGEEFAKLKDGEFVCIVLAG